MLLLELPNEVLGMIAEHTMPEGFKSFALTCKSLYNICQRLMSRPNLLDLPNELLGMIAEHTMPETFESFALTCKSLYNVCQRLMLRHNDLRRQFTFFHLVPKKLIGDTGHETLVRDASGATPPKPAFDLICRIAVEPLVARYVIYADLTVPPDEPRTTDPQPPTAPPQPQTTDPQPQTTDPQPQTTDPQPDMATDPTKEAVINLLRNSSYIKDGRWDPEDFYDGMKKELEPRDDVQPGDDTRFHPNYFHMEFLKSLLPNLKLEQRQWIRPKGHALRALEEHSPRARFTRVTLEALGGRNVPWDQRLVIDSERLDHGTDLEELQLHYRETDRKPGGSWIVINRGLPLLTLFHQLRRLQMHLMVIYHSSEILKRRRRELTPQLLFQNIVPPTLTHLALQTSSTLKEARAFEFFTRGFPTDGSSALREFYLGTGEVDPRARATVAYSTFDTGLGNLRRAGVNARRTQMLDPCDWQ